MKVKPVVILLSLTMLAFSAPTLIQVSERAPLSDSERLAAELEIGLYDLRVALAADKATSERVRAEVFKWHVANQDQFDQLAELRVAESAALPPAPAVEPGPAPIRGQLGPEEFLESADRYKAEVIAAIPAAVGKVKEERRFAIFRRLKQPDIVALEIETEQAIKDAKAIQAPAIDENILVDAQTFATLGPVEQADEEIFTLIYQLTREPLAKGEQIRDRIAPYNEWIEERRRFISMHDALESSAEVDQRISDLRARLLK
ncbi:MAG: hypothetical protein V4640_11850 [Verrucomicrobiota bacterium]